MKKLPAFLAAAAATFFIVGAGHDPSQRPPYGVSLFVPFNTGDAKDLSPYNHTPTLEGSAVVTAGTRYLTTTGATADQMTVADSDVFSFTNGSGQDLPFSVSCWMYMTALPTAGNRAGIVRKGSKQATTTWEWDCWAQLLDSTTGPAMTLRHSNSAATIGRSSPPLTTGRWYHLAFVYDGSEGVGGIKIYQDAVRVDNASGTSGTYTGMSNTATPLNVGTQSFGGTNPGLNGRTDDPQIYPFALTEVQIQQLYSAGHP